MADEEQQAKEVSKPDSETGDKPKEDTPISRANEAAERLENAIKARGEQLTREEELYANTRLGGNTDGKPQERVEETAKEYKDRIMRNQI